MKLETINQDLLQIVGHDVHDIESGKHDLDG